MGANDMDPRSCSPKKTASTFKHDLLQNKHSSLPLSKTNSVVNKMFTVSLSSIIFHEL